MDAVSSRSVARYRVCTVRCYPVPLENCFNLLREIRVIFAWTRIPHKPLDSVRLRWTLRLRGTLSDCTGLSQTVLDSLRLCWTLSDCTGLSQTVLDSLGLCWTLRLCWTLSDCTGLSQTAQDSQTALYSLRLHRTLSDCAGLSGCAGLSQTSQDSLRLRWTRSDCVGLSRDRLTLTSSNRNVSDRTLCQTEYCQP